MFPEVKTLVWYHIELDEIFIHPSLDAMSYARMSLSWHSLELLGEL